VENDLSTLAHGGKYKSVREVGAEDSAGRDATVYPRPGLFSWLVLEEKGDRYMISEYNWI
jgi:hypothetical protein